MLDYLSVSRRQEGRDGQWAVCSCQQHCRQTHCLMVRAPGDGGGVGGEKVPLTLQLCTSVLLLILSACNQARCHTDELSTVVIPILQREDTNLYQLKNLTKVTYEDMAGLGLRYQNLILPLAVHGPAKGLWPLLAWSVRRGHSTWERQRNGLLFRQDMTRSFRHWTR